MAALVRTDLQDDSGAANLAFNEKIRNLVANGHQIHHLGFGQSPFPVLEVAAEALKNYTHKNEYMAVAGIRELREVLSEFHKRYDGFTINPEDIIVGPGSKELLFLLFTIFNGEIMLLSPSWTTYRPQAQLSHHNPVMIQANMDDEWRLTPSLIDEAIERGPLRPNKLLVMCNPDNPTGTTYSSQQLKELAVALRRHNILVVTDEIYGRLAFSGQHHSLATYYPEGTIVSTGFSKWASAGGWRIGYHLYPPELRALRDAVRNAGSQTYSCAPAPMQYAICSALHQPDACDEYIQHTTRIMKVVALHCHKELTSVGVKAVMPAAGYYIFPNFELLRVSLKRRGVTTCREMCQLLMEEASVAVMAGGPDFLRPPTEFTTRLCYVDFDGSVSLAASRELGLQTDLPDDFVKEYCGSLYEAIQCLKEWVLAQLKE